jgi:hypothetical protein
MSKFTLPLTDAEPMTAPEYYPRHLVVSGVLIFCFTIWTIVILVIAHYA